MFEVFPNREMSHIVLTYENWFKSAENRHLQHPSEHFVFVFFQVIEEIEEMMQESPDPDDDESPSQSDLSMLSQDLQGLKRSGSSSSYEERQ